MFLNHNIKPNLEGQKQMKYLSDYLEKPQTECFNKHGVFFAFSNDQFNKQKNPKVEKYVSLPSGVMCPKDKAKDFIRAHKQVVKDAIEQDLKENGKEKIIIRELHNNECFYTGDYYDCVDALNEYNITDKEVRSVYLKEKDNVE